MVNCKRSGVWAGEWGLRIVILRSLPPGLVNENTPDAGGRLRCWGIFLSIPVLANNPRRTSAFKLSSRCRFSLLLDSVVIILRTSFSDDVKKLLWWILDVVWVSEEEERDSKDLQSSLWRSSALKKFLDILKLSIDLAATWLPLLVVRKCCFGIIFISGSYSSWLELDWGLRVDVTKRPALGVQNLDDEALTLDLEVDACTWIVVSVGCWTESAALTWRLAVDIFDGLTFPDLDFFVGPEIRFPFSSVTTGTDSLSIGIFSTSLSESYSIVSDSSAEFCTPEIRVLSKAEVATLVELDLVSCTTCLTNVPCLSSASSSSMVLKQLVFRSQGNKLSSNILSLCSE